MASASASNSAVQSNTSQARARDKQSLHTDVQAAATRVGATEDGLSSPTSIGDRLISQHHVAWSTHKEKILYGPFDYMFGNPGKGIRAQLIAGFNAWLNVPARSLEIITQVVGMLHTASLLCVFLIRAET